MNPNAVGNINEIIPGVYLGNQWSTDPRVLQQNRIECVLNLSGEETDMNRGRYKLFSHKILPLGDTPQESDNMLNNIIPQGIDFLDKCVRTHRKKTLVHCAAGISRSTTVLCAWIMKTYGIGRDEALTLIRSRRPIIDPNEGFRHALKQYEIYLKRFHSKNSQDRTIASVRGRTYNYPPELTPRIPAATHLTHPSIPNHVSKQAETKRFESHFAVMPSDTNMFRSEPDISYYREQEEKMYSNDDAFKHMY